MGLDFVEVFMEIEDTFQLRDFNMVPCLMPFDLVSVDDVCEVIWQRLQGREPDWTEEDSSRLEKQLTSLRQETTAYLNSLPKSWLWWLSARLDRRIPIELRDQAWIELARIWGCPPPPLEKEPQHGTLQIPISCETVARMMGVMARQWIRLNEPNTFAWRQSGQPRPPNAEKWTRELVWEKLKDLLIEQLNLTADDIQPEATLIGDLKMD